MPAALSVLPATATSTLRYAAARDSSAPAAFTSPKAVEPSSPYSSPSHEHKTMLRSGRQPVASSAPSPRATSSSAAVPELGSAAPNTHASRWLPSRMGWSSSGGSEPSIRPMTFQMGVVTKRLRVSSRTRRLDGPAR